MYEIEKILNKVAKKIGDKNQNKCYGIVTVSWSEDSQQVLYSLYLITPQLKDYSYKLISVTQPNISSYSNVESTLHASIPKNSLHGTTNNLKELEILLISFIEKEIAIFIVRFLLSQSEGLQTFELFEDIIFLNKENNFIKELDIANLKKPIHIFKISLISHFDKNSSDWISILISLALNISIKYDNGHEVSYSMPLISLLTPISTNPVFNLDFFFPSASDLNRLNLSHIKTAKCIIELKNIHNQNLQDNIELIVNYKMDKILTI
jgi:hypothetical protein